MLPTPPCITLTITSSLESLTRLCLTASTEPCTSAFMIRSSSFMLPACICSNKASSETLCLVSSRSFFLPSAMNVSAIFLASFSLSVAIIISPALGTSLRPSISTGIEGVASLTLLPLSSIMALILP